MSCKKSKVFILPSVSSTCAQNSGGRITITGKKHRSLGRSRRRIFQDIGRIPQLCQYMYLHTRPMNDHKELLVVLRKVLGNEDEFAGVFVDNMFFESSSCLKELVDAAVDNFPYCFVPLLRDEVLN